jgi:hypothetical protein
MERSNKTLNNHSSLFNILPMFSNPHSKTFQVSLTIFFFCYFFFFFFLQLFIDRTLYFEDTVSSALVRSRSFSMATTTSRGTNDSGKGSSEATGAAAKAKQAMKNKSPFIEF